MKKNIALIIICLLFAAAVIQFTRSDILFNLFRNTNQFITEIDSEKIEIPEGFEKQKYLLIYDTNDLSSVPTKDNIGKMLDYYKIDTDIVEIAELDNINFNKYENIITTFEYFESSPKFPLLFDYVKNGGRWLLAIRPVETDFLLKHENILGIENTNYLVDTPGINLLDNILLNSKGTQIKEDFIENSSLNVTLTESANLHAKSIDGTPLLWDIDYGNGKIVFFNGTMLTEKINRGLITGSLSFLNDDFIYPIINTEVNFIDDFPAPVPEGFSPSIKEEYNITTKDFYREVWWPDIQKFGFNYDLKYTGLIIQNYSNKVTPPFNDIDSKKGKESLAIYGKELLELGGELGIHGYNHQSLAPEGYIKEDLGYNPWASEDDMVLAIKEVTSFAHSVFSKYNLSVYVPPSNVLSPMGRNALIKAMPNLKMIAGVYIQEASGDAYEQEFELKDGIIEFPRLTSGYHYDEEYLWSTINGVSSLGVFSHFIHPDDILDIERASGKTWKMLSEEFNSILALPHKRYPWLNNCTGSEAVYETKKFIEFQPYIKKSENEISIVIDNFRENISFIFTTQKKITKQKGCEVKKLYENTYLIKAKGSKFTLSLK
ncbi:DUF2194 domain-containing protein [Clostridium sediminicola]|uniref:DUF2194 domain-containing protein n=1 Tax=Clostridium sediminicola TaxID=3114879 RepID=UPI0031F25EA8